VCLLQCHRLKYLARFLSPAQHGTLPASIGNAELIGDTNSRRPLPPRAGASAFNLIGSLVTSAGLGMSSTLSGEQTATPRGPSGGARAPFTVRQTGRQSCRKRPAPYRVEGHRRGRPPDWAERCDLEVRVAFQQLAQLLRQTRSVFHAPASRHMFEIEVADRIGEVPSAVIREEGECRALGRIPMHRVLSFRDRDGLDRRSSGNFLRASGGAEDQPNAEDRHGQMGPKNATSSRTRGDSASRGRYVHELHRIRSANVALQLMNGLLMRVDNPIHQIAHGDHTDDTFTL